MDYKCPLEKPPPVTPRIIIHGGAGNITPKNLPRTSWKAYRHALFDILESAHHELQEPGARALDVATNAVQLLEENPLFNAGRGAVFTTDGTHELEASVMVSRGYRKRGCGVMKVKKAKSPIKLAKEMLIRGEHDDGGGAQGHCQLEGKTCDRLNVEWGLQTVKPSWFWTRKRWDEHRRGLGLTHDDETYERHRSRADEQNESDAASEEDRESADDHEALAVGDVHWDGKEYLPQGTVGAVVLDSSGVLCVATSTGGLTNKLPGRIGDTPTLGAGFWAEEWATRPSVPAAVRPMAFPHLSNWFGDCLPRLAEYSALPWTEKPGVRAVAMSGTGNGDSFLRINAVRTAAAMARYGSDSVQTVSLQQAVTAVAGPSGQLRQSAGDRWGKTGEGEGGIIGIELREDGEGRVVFDYNRGMFHAWIDDHDRPRFAIFQEDRGRH